MSAPHVRLERVREVTDQHLPDGTMWVLVDRLWPRGLSKESLAGVRWDKDIAPSTELRRAYHHGEISHDVFTDRYREELHHSRAARALAEDARARKAREIVLLVDAHDVEESQGPTLVHVLRGLLSAR